MKRLLAHELSIVVIALIEVSIFLLVYTTTDMDKGIAYFLSFFSLFLHLLWALLSFIKERAYWQDIDSISQKLMWDNEDIIHADSYISVPHSAQEHMSFSAIETICMYTRSLLSRKNKEVQDYKDYVESWVHEAKTPIASAKLRCQNNPSVTTEAILLDLDEIDSHIDQALFYARINSVDRDYFVREMNLYDCVSSAIKQNARHLIHNKVTIRLDDSLKRLVYSDQKWLGFMLSQFIGNAIKYRDTQKERPEIYISAKTIHENTAKETTLLSLKDNGIGIAEQDLPRVFDKGFVGENGRLATQTKSTGLGLYLASSIAKKLNLNLSVKSKLGSYTEILISFPTDENVL